MAYKRNVEIFEEAYEKKDAKSVVSYVARDGRRRYIAGNKNPDGGGTPMPSGGGMTEVTWQELKDKRDNGELNPGSLYRITDYNCTTTQENTQSAGHQFDIVLLALSENKLAEEGWAMMHDNIYDVTFTDGVKKCYLYLTGEEDGYLVDCETLLGNGINTGDFDEFDADAKIITIDGLSEILNTPDLPYNYFQNSNLSAWKVWYCLDNDTARFAWADDSSNITKESVKVKTGGNVELIFYRPKYYPSSHMPESFDIDGITYYIFINPEHESIILLTISRIPAVGDDAYSLDAETGKILKIGTIIEYQPEYLVYNGRGVIYRLIDEWNNDVPWDFKNIMFTLNNETTYSLSVADQDPDYEYDATLAGATLGVIVQTTHGESRQGRTPKSIYPISRVMLQQCLIYLNKDISLDSYLFTNNGHANIIYGLEIYNPNA